jgi:hypothetical protein
MVNKAMVRRQSQRSRWGRQRWSQHGWREQLATHDAGGGTACNQQFGAGVGNLTDRATAGQFRCGIKGLRAKSVKPYEECRGGQGAFMRLGGQLQNGILTASSSLQDPFK